MSTVAASRVELLIPARPEFVAVARMAVKAVASRMPFGIDDLEDITLAAAEACTNAIEHVPVDPRGTEPDIRIRLSLEADQLVVEVQDRGVGRDIDMEPVPPDPEDLPESGWGLLLIQALMDDLHWDINSEGTTVRMTKRLAR